MLNPVDYFDTNGFAIESTMFATLEDLDSSARDFYNEIYADKIGDPEMLRQVFRDFADERGWSELDLRLVAATLEEVYGVAGMAVFR
ncbi:MAG: hypothetical protein M0Z55_05420 [Peptococcaceae bacterium]|nr:hypothetical protein [Peptococcaceae bacterium]